MAVDGLERFLELAATHNVVPVVQECLGDLLTPVAAFKAIVGERPGFLLESAEHGERWSRFSFLGRSPVATFVARGQAIEVVEGQPPNGVVLDQGVLGCLEQLLGAYRMPRLSELPPFVGGIVGYLGYDVVREVERLPQPPPDPTRLPDAVFSLVGELVAFDHWRDRVVLVENVVLPGAPGESGLSRPELEAAYDDALLALERLRRDLEQPVAEPLTPPPSVAETLEQAAVVRVSDSASYQAAVLAAKEYIAAGDAFQIVLSQRFDLNVDLDPFDVYRVLRQVNPSPYMFFLRQGGVAVAGASPEPLVRVDQGRVISRPIAGTRRRGRSEEEDRRLAAELIEHPKERAEHVMLVDLARNDLGRVVRFGTEQVDELMTLERYSHVMHLTSQVSGELVGECSPIDVLRATLPAGTVSGAPKVRAMEIIDELEPVKRGPYAGIVAYLDFSGNLDTAIAIRTLVADDEGHAFVQAGAGIVADSDPAAEDLECQNKAASVLTAVAGARRLAAERAARAQPRARGAGRATPLAAEQR